MAITIPGSAWTGQVSTTGYTFTTASTLGHTPATGNSVVIEILNYNTNATITAPGGWVHDRRVTGGSLGSVDFYSRLIDGTESATYAWTWTSANNMVGAWEVNPGGATLSADTGVAYTGGGAVPTSIGSTATLASATEVAFGGGITNGPTTGPGLSGGGTWVVLTPGSGGSSVLGYLLTSSTTALAVSISGSGGSATTFAAGVQTYSIPPTVTKTVQAIWNVGGTVTKAVQALWNTGGTVSKTVTGLWNVKGPLAAGWKVTTEVAWSTAPLTRPAPGDWTVLTEGIKSLTIKRGTKILSTGIETGTATAVLENTARNIDPDYAPSPYAPNVIPRRRVRFVLRDAAGNLIKVLHTGFIERYQRSWALDTAYVTIPSQDLFGVISGVNLPISVLDYITKQLAPDAYYPLGNQAGAALAADEMGNNGFAAYGLPLQSSGLLTNYDARAGMTCGRPTGSNIVSQNIVRFPYSVPQTVTVAGWFRHIPGDDVTMNPTVLTLQDGGGTPFTFTGSPGHNAAFISIKHTAGSPDCHAGIVLRDPSNFSGWASTTNYPMLDGNPHFLVAAINGSTKALTLWVDGVNQGALSNVTGVGLASMNVSGILSGVNMFAAGWGIVWDSASTDNNDANVGQLSVFQRILTDADVLSMWNAGATAWDNDRTDVRLGRIFDIIGVDPGDRNFDVGTQTCGPARLAAQPAISYTKKVVATEQGACFVNGDGKARFTARPSPGSPTQVFSDDPTGDGGAAVEPWVPDYGWDRIVNTVDAVIEDGTSRVVQDATSKAKFGPLGGSVGAKIDTLARNITDAVATVQWVIDGHKNPTSYVPSVKVSSIDQSVSQDALLGVEVSDLIAVIGRPPSPTVAPIGLQAEVEHVQYDFPNPTELTTTYSPGDGSPYP